MLVTQLVMSLPCRSCVALAFHVIEISKRRVVVVDFTSAFRCYLDVAMTAIDRVLIWRVLR